MLRVPNRLSAPRHRRVDAHLLVNRTVPPRARDALRQQRVGVRGNAARPATAVPSVGSTQPSQPHKENLTAEGAYELINTPPSGESVQCMGFYPTQPMWVGQCVVPLPAEMDGRPEIALIMLESIKRYQHDDYTLYFTRDGMVVIALSATLLKKEGIVVNPRVASGHTVTDAINGSQTSLGRTWALYLDHLNAVHLLLASSRQDWLQSLHFPVPQFISEVALSNAIVIRYYPDDPLQRSVPQLCPLGWEPRSGSAVIEKDVLPATVLLRVQCPVLTAERYELLDAVDRQLSECNVGRVRLLAVVARAIHAYQELSHSTCVTLLWTVIEKLIRARYKALVAHQAQWHAAHAAADAKSGTKKWVKKLIQQQQKQQQKPKNISAQIWTLHKHNRLPRGGPSRDNTPSQSAMLEFFERARQSRNEFLHNVTQCDDEQCIKAYAVLMDLVREDWNIKLPRMQKRALINISCVYNERVADDGYMRV